MSQKGHRKSDWADNQNTKNKACQPQRLQWQIYEFVFTATDDSRTLMTDDSYDKQLQLIKRE